MARTELKTLSRLADDLCDYGVTTNSLRKCRDRDEAFPFPAAGRANTGYLYDAREVRAYVQRRSSTLQQKMRKLDERASSAVKAGLTALPGVYFVQCGEFVKIGTAQHIANRVNSHQVSSPYPMTLLGSIVIPSLAVRRRTEKEWHERWAAAHHRGEWFHATSELLAEIKKVGR